jgi:hypothetical protein
MTDDRFNPENVLPILREGRIELAGRFVYGSNYTFLADVRAAEGELQAVYKPSQGERPLWDFPLGTLAQREVAAYEVSRGIGWDLVPPTILRRDGPAGEGSLQVFIDPLEDKNYFTLTHEEKGRLRPVALFDALINNADRKGGHILLTPTGKLWLIDHGVCFHRQDKLRTVIWDFAGDPIPQPLLDDLRGFLQAIDEPGLGDRMAQLLSTGEIDALISRGERLLSEGSFPRPGSDRPYPWPLV